MDFWMVFCGENECQNKVGKSSCSSGVMAIMDSSSCPFHLLITSATMLLSFVLILVLIQGEFHSRSRNLSASASHCISLVSISSMIFSGCLALAYFGYEIRTVLKILSSRNSLLPLQSWISVSFQGLTWLLQCLLVSKKKPNGTSFISTLKICSFNAFVTGFLTIASTRDFIARRISSTKDAIDALSFPGALLLLIWAIQEKKDPEADEDKCIEGFSESLKGEEANESIGVSSKDNITPFAEAGFLSKLSFFWLNPLLKRGKEKTLEDQDIPDLRPEDTAETCYSMFKEQMNKQKQDISSDHDQSSMFLSILLCHRKAILISGFFALVKILTLSTGPVFLYAFINFAKGKEAFKCEAYALTAGIFVAKCMESVAGRQWLFRSRLIGRQTQSMLTAAIYKKQLRLSNAAKNTHSPGEIMNYVTVDAYKIGEFMDSLHRLWTISLQICIGLVIIYFSVGLGTVMAVVVLVLSMLGNIPVAKLQHKYLTQVMLSQDRMMKAIAESLSNMKILKLYNWEMHFKNIVVLLREEHLKWLLKIQTQQGYSIVMFWSTPIIVSAVTFWSCYLLNVPLTISNAFTFLATLRILQDPIRLIPDIIGVIIEAKVSFSRIVKFLAAPELQNSLTGKHWQGSDVEHSVLISSQKISWDVDSLNPSMENINLKVRPGEKIAICGDVGSGKSTILAATLGEVPCIDGFVEVRGKIAYVSQNAWIQTGTIQQNILFGSNMDKHKYEEVLKTCCLVEDLDILPFGDQTLIGERGVNLSGGQKQRVQLARALYREADIYLLDDPFSAVDAHTAISLFNGYVMGALLKKTVLLVTHQVDFLPAFDSIVLLSKGRILKQDTYIQLLDSSQEFRNLVHAHREAAKSETEEEHGSHQRQKTREDVVQKIYSEEILVAPIGGQLIKQEERETGYTGLKPYLKYLRHNKGILWLSLSLASHVLFLVGQLVQYFWLATNLQDYSVSKMKLTLVYSLIGCGMMLLLLLRSYAFVILGLKSSKSIYDELMTSLFHAPMSFFDSTPLGRILSRVSSDLSIVDRLLPTHFHFAFSTAITMYFSLGILTTLTRPILFVIIPMVYVTIRLQTFYIASAKELIRIRGTTKSSVASYLSESIAGSTTIRAFGEEDRFFSENLKLIDKNGSSSFHSFSANEWLIQRLELLCAIILSSSALALTLLPLGASKSGYIGMTLSYALSLNVFLVCSVTFQCTLEDSIVSSERLEQYMHIPSEAPETIQSNRPPPNWPSIGKVEIQELKVRYRPNTPLVLQGITCTFEGGHKVGIVGRTGSGKSTLISALFRIVEPAEGAIVIDELNISTIGIHDLRSHLGVIPQDPTLFGGTIRYNLDPLSEHTDHEIWEVLDKCQLRDVVQNKEEGLNSIVTQNGSNWSMGQRQLFCLGRALLKRRKILVLDEATASIDNATDAIIQKIIRREFANCTVITVAHRIPTVMDCTMVLALRDGKVVEYDKPMKLMNEEGSLFRQLVREYWSHSKNAKKHQETIYVA